jgi:hypothetical protein
MRRPVVLALFLVLFLAACKTAPIYDVPNRTFGGSLASLEEASVRIDRAARLQNWETEQTSPGVMIVTKRRGRHVAAATVRYDTDSFSISLRNSIALKQAPDGTIHKLYNVWAKGLENAIRQEVSAPN